MSRIIFTKYSNERAKCYALRTDIVEDAGQKVVKKRALYPQGEAHIRDIEYYYQVLNRRYQDSRICINRCGRCEDGVILEYLEGKTLEELLDGYLLEGNIDLLMEHLFEYLEEVKKGFTKEEFVMTPEFERVFGSVALPEHLLSADVADVDMVLNNVIVDGAWKLIDYEWSFNFPIPYHFVVYRILHYYLHSSSTRNVLLSYGLMEKAGLTPEEIAVYEQMEQHFQNVYVVTEKDGSNRHITLRSLYEDMTPGAVDVKDLGMDEEVNRRQRLVQLYQAPDLNFDEEHSESKTLYKEGIFLDGFSVDPASRCVRLDPASCYCIVRRLQMQWGREITRYRTNGIAMEDGALLFSVDDPQIIVEKPAEGADTFRAYFEIEYLSAEDALYLTQNAYGRANRRLQEVQSTLQQREALIHEMENTKVWKAYRKIKKQ